MKQRIVLFNNLTSSEDTSCPHGESVKRSLKFEERNNRGERGDPSNPLTNKRNMRGRQQYRFSGFPLHTNPARPTAQLFSSKSAHMSIARSQTNPDENQKSRLLEEKGFVSQDNEDISLYMGQRSGSGGNGRTPLFRSSEETTWFSGKLCGTALICLTCLFFSLWYSQGIDGMRSKGINSVDYTSRTSFGKLFGAPNKARDHTRSKAFWMEHVVQGGQSQILIPETFESRYNNEVAPLLDNHLDRIWKDKSHLRCLNGEHMFAAFSLKDAEVLPATISFDKQCERVKQLHSCFQEHEVSDLRQLQVQVPSKSSLSSYSVTILINRSEENSRNAQIIGVARGIVQIMLSDLSKLALKRYCSRHRHHFAEDATLTSNSDNDVRVIPLYELKRLYGALAHRTLDTGYFTTLWDVNELSKATIDLVQHSRHRREREKDSSYSIPTTNLAPNESDVMSSSSDLENERNQLAKADEAQVWDELLTFNNSGNKNSSDRLAPTLVESSSREQTDNRHFNPSQNAATSEGNEHGVDSEFEQQSVTNEDQDEPRGGDDDQQESEHEAEPEDDEEISTASLNTTEKHENAFSSTSVDDGNSQTSSEHSIIRTDSTSSRGTRPDSHVISASISQNRSEASTDAGISSGPKITESVPINDYSSKQGTLSPTALDIPHFVEENRSSRDAPQTAASRHSLPTHGSLTQRDAGISYVRDNNKVTESSRNTREIAGSQAEPFSGIGESQFMENIEYAHDSRQESSPPGSRRSTQDAVNSRWALHAPLNGMPAQQMHRDSPRVHEEPQRGVSSSKFDTQTYLGNSRRAPMQRSVGDISYDKHTARTWESQQPATGPSSLYRAADSTMAGRNSRVKGNLISGNNNHGQVISMQYREPDPLRRVTPMGKIPQNIPDHYPMETKSSNAIGRKSLPHPGILSPAAQIDNRAGSRELHHDPSRNQPFLMRERRQSPVAQQQSPIAQLMQNGLRSTGTAGYSNYRPEEGLTHSQPGLDPRRMYYGTPYSKKESLDGTYQTVTGRIIHE